MAQDRSQGHDQRFDERLAERFSAVMMCIVELATLHLCCSNCSMVNTASLDLKVKNKKGTQPYVAGDAGRRGVRLCFDTSAEDPVQGISRQ